MDLIIYLGVLKRDVLVFLEGKEAWTLKIEQLEKSKEPVHEA